MSTPRPYIPAAVLALLETKWLSVEDTGDIFESRVAYRRTDPSFYFTRKDGEGNPCTYAELAALKATGIFEGMLRVKGECFVMNEHASHALQMFLAETQASWEKCKDRLEKTRANTRGDLLL